MTYRTKRPGHPLPARPHGALDKNPHDPGLLDYGLCLLEREADAAREETLARDICVDLGRNASVLVRHTIG